MTGLGQSPALSIRQPWASLILDGRKSIEVRTWSTVYRGLLWIHTGRSASRELLQRFDLERVFRGGFIGAARLGACLRMDASRWLKWESRHLAGPALPRGKIYWAWMLTDPVAFREPLPGGGELGLFQPQPTMQRRLFEALAAEGGRALLDEQSSYL